MPDFSSDPDIAGTADSLAQAESMIGRKWDFTFAEPPVNPADKAMYNFAPDLDDQMKTSLKNTKQAESDLDF